MERLSAASTGYLTEVAAIRAELAASRTASGSRRHAAYRPAIGDLTRLYEVWEHPDGPRPDDADAAQAYADRLRPLLREHVSEEIEPVFFSPPPDRAGALAGDRPALERTYLFVTLLAKSPQQREAVIDLVSRSLGVIEEIGWKLVGSYAPVVGDLTKLFDIWEVPDANSILSAMASFPDRPDLVEIRQHLIPNNVAHELTQLVRKVG
jgi:hypothetical protein